MTRSWSLYAVFRYEFLMQIRRPAAWLTTLGITLLVLLLLARLALPGDSAAQNSFTLAARLFTPLGYFLPIVFGILMADRLPRERRLNTAELLDSLPVSPAAWLWGKYLGAAVATAVPIAIAYLAVAALAALRLGEATLVLAFPAVFLGVTLPGLLLVAAYSVACTEVLPTSLYSILFVGYWFWGNVLPPSRLPTMSCTPLTPIGKYAAVGLFGDPAVGCGLVVGSVSWLGALGSILLLLAWGALAMLALGFYRSRRAAAR